MSKVCIMLNLDISQYPTAEELDEHRLRVQYFCAGAQYHWVAEKEDCVYAKTSVIATKKAYQHDPLIMTTVIAKNSYGAEMVISDAFPGDDITRYSAAEQLAILSSCKDWAELGICGRPKTPAVSYKPQGGMNADTITALLSLGINTVGSFQGGDNFKVVFPNATPDDDLAGMVEDGRDIVLYLSTNNLRPIIHRLPADTSSLPLNGYGNAGEYPTDLLPFLEAARLADAQFVLMKDF